MIAISAEPRVPPLETRRPAASEMISAGICVTRPSPTDSRTNTSAAMTEIHVVAGDTDDDAAENVDGRDDDAGDCVAAHELRGTVHRTEEGAFLFELAPAPHRLLLVDVAGGEIGIDGHLLAGNGVEGEAGANLGDARCTLGDDEEVDRDQDDEHHGADDEVAAHHEVGKSCDDMPGRIVALERRWRG